MDLFIGSGPANGTVAPDFHFENQLKQTGKSTFQRISNTQFVADSLDGQTWNWIDFDNDGDLDVFMTNYVGTSTNAVGMPNNLYRNDGDSLKKVTSDPLVQDVSVSLANMWADFDNDGDLDVIVGNSGTTNKHYLNDGQGNFVLASQSPLEEPGAKRTWGMTNGDYDNDGDIDIFISNKTGYINGGVNGGDVNFLYRNDLDTKYNWFTLQCVGTDSNKSAIGAIVRLTAKLDGKSVTQIRVIGTNNTFLGDNDIRAHFGLKNASYIDSLEIQWPSGKNDKHTGIAVNQIMVAVEGELKN